MDISRAFLDTNGVTQTAEVPIDAPDAGWRLPRPHARRPGGKPLTEAFRENLSRPGGVLPEGPGRAV